MILWTYWEVLLEMRSCRAQEQLRGQNGLTYSHNWPVVLAAGWVFRWACWPRPHFPSTWASLHDSSSFFTAGQLGSTRSAPRSKGGSQAPQVTRHSFGCILLVKTGPRPKFRERGKRLPFDVGVARLYAKGTCGVREIAVATYLQMKFLDNII